MVKIFLGIFILIQFLVLPYSSKAIDQNVILNEIMPKPDDEIEWIEIYNPTSKTIDLTGWQIKDGNSVSSDDLTLNGQINPLEFKVFEHTKGWLNDSGQETVSLLNGFTTIDSYSYNGSSQGKSIGRQPDGVSWVADLIPSKGQTNGNLPTPTSIPTSILTPTDTPTPTPIFSPTPTLTPTSTPTPTKTPTPKPTIKPTHTPTPTSFRTPTPTLTPTTSMKIPSSILGSSASATPALTPIKTQVSGFTFKNISLTAGGIILILVCVLVTTFIVKGKSKNI